MNNTRQLNKKFNIPGWVKGNSIAEEAKSIMKKFEGRNSKADKDTMQSLLDRLMQKQEFVKEQIDTSMRANSTQVPDMMGGQVPPEMQNQAAFGAIFGDNPDRTKIKSVNELESQGLADAGGANINAPDESTSIANKLQSVGSGGGNMTDTEGVLGKAGVVGGAYGVLKNFWGNSSVQSGRPGSGGATIGGTAASGAATGLSIGGPWGALIGGVIGAGAGAIMHGKNRKKAAKVRGRAASLAASQYNKAKNNLGEEEETQNAYGGAINKLKFGGNMNSYANGGPDPDPKEDSIDHLLTGPGFEKAQYPAWDGETTAVPKLNLGSATTTYPYSDAATGKKVKDPNKKPDWENIKDQAFELGAAAPILANLFSKVKKGSTTAAPMVDTVYKQRYSDMASAYNRVNQYDARGAAKASSAGNLGSYAANLRAGNIAKLKGLSQEAQGIRKENRAEDAKTFDSKFKNSIVNARAQERFIDRKEQTEGAYNTAKMMKRTAVAEDIGKFFREQGNKELVKEMFGYTWNGKYFVDKKGNKVDNKVVFAQIQDKQKEEENGNS